MNRLVATTAKAAVFLLAFSLARSVLSLVVRSSIAGMFGAGLDSDAYFAAFTIPQQVGDLFIGGILMAVIIPVFQERRVEVGEDEAARDVAGLLNLSLAAMVALAALYFVLVPRIVPILFPGFDDATRSLAVSLSRWLAPTLVLMGLSLVYVSFYHAHRDFVTPALATLFFPLSSLAALWLLPTAWGIHRLAYGNLAGSLLGLGLLMTCIHARIPWRWRWRCWNPVVRSVVLLAWPILLANLAAKLVPLAQKNVASTLEAGAITLLDYALFLTEAVLAFIAAPVATAIYPLLGEQRAREGEEIMFSSFFEALRLVLFLATPCVILQFAAAGEMALILFGHGKFSAGDAVVCAQLLAITAVMILPQCVSALTGRLFFALQETKAPALVGIALTVIALPCYFVFGRRFGIHGLAGVWTGTYVVVGLAQLALLKGMRRSLCLAPLWRHLARLATAAAVMVAAITLIRIAVAPVPFPLARLAALAVAGGTAYLLANHILGGREPAFLLRRMPGGWLSERGAGLRDKLG